VTNGPEPGSKMLFLAGPPDVVDSPDPLGAFEGRKGGLLWVFDANTGTKLAAYRLDSPPVFNGIAAAEGRVYLSLTDGRVVCLGTA
jgi:outer membrane protein assembly factor BamB